MLYVKAQGAGLGFSYKISERNFEKALNILS